MSYSIIRQHKHALKSRLLALLLLLHQLSYERQKNFAVTRLLRLQIKSLQNLIGVVNLNPFGFNFRYGVQSNGSFETPDLLLLGLPLTAPRRSLDFQSPEVRSRLGVNDLEIGSRLQMAFRVYAVEHFFKKTSFPLAGDE